jgi:hypothetical protein
MRCETLRGGTYKRFIISPRATMHKRVKVCIRVRPSSKDHAGIVVNEQEKV